MFSGVSIEISGMKWLTEFIILDIKYHSTCEESKLPRLILDTYCARYIPTLTLWRFRLFFLLIFSYSKNFEFACCLVGFLVRIALNLLKSALFIHTACIPCFSKLCPAYIKMLDCFRILFPHLYFIEHLRNTASEVYQKT